MARAQGMDDMFGHVPQRGELSLAEQAAPARTPGVSHVVVGGFEFRTPHTGHTIETVRETLQRMIAFIRGFETLPWDAYELRYMTGGVVHLAEWLKHGEGDAMMAEFKAEMDRLNAPADQLAPNWRKVWGIAD